MRNWFRPALIGAAVLTVSAAAAYAAPSPTLVALTTTASADPQTAALGFVKSYPAATEKLQQIARWSDAICVEVSGLSADKAKVVQARVEEVANAVGVKAQPAGCRHNIEIVFTAKPQAFLDDIAEHQKVLLGYDHAHAKTVKTVSHPIQSWYMTSTVGGGGPNAGALFAYNSGGLDQGVAMQTRERVRDDPNNRPPTGCGDSHFSACLRSVFDNALVVVDTAHVGNVSVGVISDYVAMLALSQPRALNRCNVLPSVTDLFAGACSGRGAPDGITPADAAYLTALYSADPEASTQTAQADIAGRMAKMLATVK